VSKPRAAHGCCRCYTCGSSDVKGSIHQWASVDGIWHISLSNQFLSLYCTTYQGYDEVEKRLRALLAALPASIPVPLVDRVGVRYVNRISDDQDMANLHALVQPEILGHSPLTGDNSGATLVASINQAAYNVDGALLQVRSGVLAPNETPDAAIPALQKQSWVLDLDASIDKRIPFEANSIISEFSRMSDLAYDYFKSVSTPGFIERFSKKG